MKKVVITGSRDWPWSKARLIGQALLDIDIEFAMEEVVEFHEGECPYGGADEIGAFYANLLGWKVIPHPPIEEKGWAYAKRNQEMIDENPDYVVACFLEGAGNRGTQMTYDMAVKAGLKDRIVEVRA